ncbi:MFS general substrate transporter [Patellaria atrata CBS 101060]|uniref:MFS general substrate transporter n=1 Tax=Patellaria atrata CBS 101060 TaxID=1346257 RepID=A0A9P4VNB0_9PEZI|nr:MFS general substrate transporter [Patellaria atrata CBS 101060]
MSGDKTMPPSERNEYTLQNHYPQILIDNPLRQQTPRQTGEDARAFHSQHNLEDVVDVETFVRAALAARDPDPEAYRNIQGLTYIERRELDKEGEGGILHQILHLPRDYWINLATCCFAAITQGWDQSSINGANLGWPREFGLNVNLMDPTTHAHDVWLFAIVNASTYLSAGIVGCWLSDPLNSHFYGRRGALFTAGLFSFATVIGAAYTQSWKTLLLCRILLGFGMGAKASVVPIFASETAPRATRGSLVISWQLMDAFGIFLGFAANIVVYDSWRKMVAAAFIPALLLLILVPLCTESPRWLLKKGRYKDALNAFARLRGASTPLLACRDLYYTHVQIQSETKYLNTGRYHRNDPASGGPVISHDDFQREVEMSSYGSRFLQLFTIPRIRRASVSAFVIMIAQQTCGVNVLAFLSSTIFNDAIQGEGNATQNKSAEKKALWFSFGIGLANFFFTWLAMGTIDSKGRRYLLHFSFPNMAWTLLAAGLCFLIDNDDLRIGLHILFVFLFFVAYSGGEGPVAFILSSEVFPLVNREVGMSFAVFWNLFGAGILALVSPILAYALTYAGLLGLFAGLNLVSWAAVFFLVPETAQFELEDLNSIFEIRTLAHIKYRFAVLKWVFRLTKDEPAPLYIWASEQRSRGVDMNERGRI